MSPLKDFDEIGRASFASSEDTDGGKPIVSNGVLSYTSTLTISCATVDCFGSALPALLTLCVSRRHVQTSFECLYSNLCLVNVDKNVSHTHSPSIPSCTPWYHNSQTSCAFYRFPTGRFFAFIFLGRVVENVSDCLQSWLLFLMIKTQQAQTVMAMLNVRLRTS
jgi:hypothetical protein